MALEFDFAPGAQVPLSGVGVGHTGISQAIASVAYREGVKPEDIREANEGASVKKGRFTLLEPDLGEAFTRAIETRMLDAGRKPLIQSFGAEPQTVVEQSLAAKRLRRQRDRRLTTVMLVFGVLFLPGVAVWLGLFQLRRTIAGAQDKRAGAFGMAALVGVVALLVLLLVRAPLNGVLLIYAWASLVAPVLGWLWARQLCERTARALRENWGNLVGGGGGGARVPEAVPQNPNDAEAERLRVALAKLAAEQSSNLIYYGGPEQGIHGMGVRWCAWQLAEEMRPRDPGRDIDPFRSWDVARAIHDQLRLLERGPLHTGGFPTPSIVHWIVRDVGGASEVSRPSGDASDGFSFSSVEVQRICNEQQFDSDDRHYVGVQFVLRGGSLVITVMISVTVLHYTLRIEVTGYSLGPLHGFFYKKPGSKSKKVRHPVKFWKKVDRPLPLVEVREVVRLAARAPLTWFPKLLDAWGGTLTLPEPFGLRHTWATTDHWDRRFQADDALRAVTPILRVAHTAAFRVLEENGVDISNFESRSQSLSGQVQAPSPAKVDRHAM
ncbi:hypothetical protein ACTWP5_08460 [Streptomyces sp. 4N509B]|uniref:hypothetical protein n=1 Tax=Streptomyces sp. 4N509B TaxID=3457413 RepID=UPI003FD6718A